jgi:4-amino-4-deoxy-L-arabinose transferase-like glycosyltransferase
VGASPYPSLAQHAVRLYVEGLSTFLTLAAAVLVLGFRRTQRMRIACILGLVCGLATLAKLHGLVLIAFLAVLAAVHGIRGERRLALGWASALALSIAVALPWLVRNQVLYGSAFYPAFAPDLDRAFFALFQRKFGTPPLQFLAALPMAFGVPLASGAVLGVVAAIWRRRCDLSLGLLAFSYVGVVALALAPLTQLRHVNPLVPVLALASACMALDVVSRRSVLRVVDAALLVVATVAVFRMPDLRTPVDPPRYLPFAFEEIVQRVPVDATILSVWTYDTLYYTRRPSTWPIPWGQKAPLVALFYEPDPDRLLEGLKRCGIDYLLVPTYIRPVAFDGANYPESLLGGLEALVNRGSLDVAWHGHGLLLLRNPRG